MPEWIKIRNWSTFQHYKERNPPWIKLHRSLLDNREYWRLSDGAARLLVELWLLASERKDGRVAHDLTNLEWRLRRPRDEVVIYLKELADAAFVTLPDGGACDMLADASAAQDRGEESRELPTGISPQPDVENMTLDQRREWFKRGLRPA